LIRRILAEEGARFTLTADAEAALLEHSWPATCASCAMCCARWRRCTTRYGDARSLLQQLPKELTEPAREKNAARRCGNRGEAPTLELDPGDERQALLRMLEDHRWNVSNVAKRSRSAATRSTASSTASTSNSRAASVSTEEGAAADARIRAARPAQECRQAAFRVGHYRLGHMLEESLAIARELPNVDLYLSEAAAEVLPLYKLSIETLKRDFRVFRDNSRSSVRSGCCTPTSITRSSVAPATSNHGCQVRVRYLRYATHEHVRASGKLGIPGIVYACDTEPVVITRSPAGVGGSATAQDRAGKRRTNARD
jgi:hypothetical protein